jgi:hypothetical protein
LISQSRASVPGQGDQLGPGDQVAGEGDDCEPDPVLRVGAEKQVGQPGVLGLADPVFAAGAAAVPELEIGELSAGSTGPGVGRERGDAVALDAGDPQLCAEWGGSRRIMTRIPVGQEVRSSRPVSSATNAPGRVWPSAS